VCMRCPMR